MMRELIVQTLRHLKAGEKVVWCIILRARGSTPRGVGAKMAVFADCSSYGTVGGGAVEYQAITFARAMGDRKVYVRDYDLYSGGSEATGMVCGGQVQIGFLSLEPTDEEFLENMLPLWEEKLPESREWLFYLEFQPDRFSIRIDCSDVYDLHRLDDFPPRVPTVFEKDGGLLYVEAVNRKDQVYIFGAGHVSQALVPVLLPLGFSITVLDSRPELVQAQRFHGASLLCASFEPIPDSLTINERDYVVVMTPGHEKDLAVLRQVLKTPASYIGCIGSRKKTAYVNQVLLEEGFSKADVARIHAPIGLPIKAKTPEEIAVSIAAEMILFRAERGSNQ